MSPETNSTDRSYVGVKTSRVIPPAAGSSLYVASSAIASWSAKVVMAPAGDRSSASRDSARRARLGLRREVQGPPCWSRPRAGSGARFPGRARLAGPLPPQQRTRDVSWDGAKHEHDRAVARD